MEYYRSGSIYIRTLALPDARIFCDEEIAQGWNQTIDKYIDRLNDFNSGKCISFVAEYDGSPAGYINVYPNSQWGAFAGRGWCEIVDFGVLQKYRNKGIGTKLMDIAEETAAKYSDNVYLGVGLHSGYGAAQRMYVKRGYIPDGSGVWYKEEIAKPYEVYCNDDDLNIYLSKHLKP